MEVKQTFAEQMAGALAILVLPAAVDKANVRGVDQDLQVDLAQAFNDFWLKGPLAQARQTVLTWHIGDLFDASKSDRTQD
ncbi:hypothetical protein [Ramlibacter sp.]|uniref:hypothetical protein n=1 Tax=Ramlibacter sp. TaxID=1917967 RepID=UPI003D11DD96